MRPSRLLLPLTPLYASALALKDAAYAHGRLRPSRLAAPVVSVGNLSVGGSGKTPFVRELARLLAARGYAVDILSRGYGRRSGAAARVDPHAAEPASLYGDEPVLLAYSTGLPVYVGARRYSAGLLAEAQAGERAPGLPPNQQIHLLDDGFQHRQLARNVDIVLFHPGDLTELLLPAGRLRERLTAIARAHIVVLREEDTETESALRACGLSLPVWRAARGLSLPTGLEGPVLAFCGIARPDEFFAALRGSGVSLAATRSFRDHHAYTSSDLAQLSAQARAAGAGHFVTTEKDWVRLAAAARERLVATAPLHAIPLQTRLLHEEVCMAQLVALLPDLQTRTP